MNVKTKTKKLNTEEAVVWAECYREVLGRHVAEKLLVLREKYPPTLENMMENAEGWAAAAADNMIKCLRDRS